MAKRIAQFLTEEHKRNISKAHKGKKKPWAISPMKGKKWSEEYRKKNLEGRKLKKKPRSLESRIKMSLRYRREKGSNWKGGINPINNAIRNCFRYRLWRSDVFQRDDYVCQECKIRGGKLHAHHIIQMSDILHKNSVSSLEDALNCEELWNMDNGITLCEPCHKKIPVVH